MPISAGRGHRYLFVGGLHRSGTSLVARMAAALPGAGGIEDAPVPENEGVYLQGGVPHDALAGRPMHFATDPNQHLTETHPLNRLETRTRMEADWAAWFPPDVTWRVEKSPVNLTRMRLLQQLFPLSAFVVVLRHPAAVAAAVAKWVEAPPSRLVDHWLDAHDRVAGDLPRLHSVLVLRYEDLVRRPDALGAALAAFMDLPAATAHESVRDGNAEYALAPDLAGDQAARAARWGYGAGLFADPAWQTIVQHPLRAVRDEVHATLAGGPAVAR